MLLKTKLTIIVSVTAVMGIGFFMMAKKGLVIPCVILLIVWVCHLLYFFLAVKTLSREDGDAGRPVAEPERRPIRADS